MIKIAFTSESKKDLHWARYLSTCFLTYRGFSSKIHKSISKRLLSADLWFLGTFDNCKCRPFNSEEEKILKKFKGKIICFHTDDSLDLFDKRFSPEGRGRVDYWIQRAHIDDPNLRAEKKYALMPPFIPPTVLWHPARIDYMDRDKKIIFYAGMKDPKTNNRLMAVRLLKEKFKSLFNGGIFENNDSPEINIPEDVYCGKIGRYKHMRLLSKSAIGLAIAGNNPLTYRFMECLSAGTLCISSSFADIKWMNGHLKAGEHYIEVKDDLSDLEDKVAYFLDHPKEAGEIAAAGYAQFKRYFIPRNFIYNELLMKDFYAQFGENLILRRGILWNLSLSFVDMLQPLLQVLKEYRVTLREKRTLIS